MDSDVVVVYCPWFLALSLAAHVCDNELFILALVEKLI